MSLADQGVPRILIAADEAPARARLRDLLDDCRPSFPLAVVEEARNGREALDVLNRQKVDIVLLDIRMPEMDGMEAARHIAGMEAPPAIIFTTAFDGYAIKAFEVNAIDYLLKPIRRERLQLHFDAEASMRSEVRDGTYRVTIRMPYITAPA